jgi:tRNA threonylcarbamoyladenosine biosynthesis protein TsaE
MSIDLNYQIKSTSFANTEKLGFKIGKNLRGGELIELISDLGGGKTVIAKGLARGAGSKDIVSSPTFTISKVYRATNFDIHHFDFYRLADPGIVSLELSEVINDGKSVVIIEWADIVAGVLPTNRLTIKIESTGENERTIGLSAPSSLAYLFEGLNNAGN